MSHSTQGRTGTHATAILACVLLAALLTLALSGAAFAGSSSPAAGASPRRRVAVERRAGLSHRHRPGRRRRHEPLQLPDLDRVGELPSRLQLPHLVRRRLQARARRRRELGGQLRCPALDLPPAPGPQVERRPAADRARCRLHLQPDPRHAALDVHPVPGGRDQRDGARRPHRRDHDREAELRHAGAVHPDPARAHLEQGRSRQARLLQEPAVRRLGPVSRDGGQEEPLDHARGQPGLSRGARRAAQHPDRALRDLPDRRHHGRRLQGRHP